MSSVYPTISDFDALVRSLLPAPAAIPPGEDYAQALAYPWSLMEIGLEALVVGLVDIDAAAGGVLDLAGSRVGESRGGLDDTEYRRIIAGRRLAIGSYGRPSDVAAVFAALTGAEVRLYRLASGPDLVMFGQVAWTPTTPYLKRAGAVLGDAVEYGVVVEASLYPTAGMLFDAGPPFDAGVFAYSIPVS